jgi:hypothetical protein
MRPNLWLYLAVCFLSACTAFSPYNQTAEEVNRSATQYFDNALLLNVVRSSLYEPLTFITITSLDGTESATGTLGIPSIVFGPHAAASPKNYVFGPNSTSRTNSNTFHVSVVDDPASFEALLTPLNPGLVALFIGQGYDRSLMFFLTVSRIRVIQPKTAKAPEKVLAEYRNDPDHSQDFEDFQGEMASLLVEGLTAQTDITSIAAGKSFPQSKLCFDPVLPKPAFDQPSVATLATKLTIARAQSAPDVAKFLPSQPVPNVNTPAGQVAPTAAQPTYDTCNSGDGWLETKISANSGSAQNGSGQNQNSPPAGTQVGGVQQSPGLIVGPDGSLWIIDLAANKVTRVAVEKTGALGKPIDVTLTQPPAKPAPPQAPTIAYPLTTTDDGAGVTYQVFMRSTYGVYDYIGALIRGHHDISNLLAPDNSKYGGIVNISESSEANGSSASDCFSSVSYRGETYCVPTRADNTKKLFALLHDLQQLMTAPSNAPTTLQVTTVP